MIAATKPRPEFNVGYARADFGHSPMLVFYEVTRACDLICAHCRACAQAWRHPEELSGQLSRDLIDQLASFPRKPLLVFTGGDPLKRDDIFDLIRYATDAGLETAMTPSATPLVTDDAIVAMRQAGLGRMAVSIDGADAPTHDALRGIEGTFDRGLRILRTAGALGMPLQVNTTITARNFDQIDAMAELFATFGISLWSVFFLIPVGRGVDEHRITPEQYEIAFEKLWRHARQQPFGVKTTEAHHYRRFVLQQKGNPQASPFDRKDQPLQRAPLGINDGKGVMFISHKGEVHPSGFMPIDCGRFPQDSVVDIYQNNALFQSLRDPDQFDGKCGVCEFRQVCGGSRARAYTVTGNPLGSEPDCVYQPRTISGVAS
jgi:radical SAM protein